MYVVLFWMNYGNFLVSEVLVDKSFGFNMFWFMILFLWFYYSEVFFVEWLLEIGFKIFEYVLGVDRDKVLKMIVLGNVRDGDRCGR